MEQAGLDRVVRAEAVAVMGITEVVRHMPRIYREYRRLVAALQARRPDVAVLIDFPDVNFRLAKHCKRLRIPVVWFVGPQLWAWKRKRLRWVQQRVDRMLAIFPFEEPFYRTRGVEAEFVGHPLASLPLPQMSREEYATAHMAASSRNPQSSTPAARPWVALLPGSRWKEIVANLPVMLEAAAQLGPGFDFLIPWASTIDATTLSQFVFQELLPKLSWPLSSITLVPDARAAMFHARASVVASGTATVQAALIGNPFLVVYRVSPLTFSLAKRLVRYPDEIPAPVDQHGNLPIGMVNLIAGRRIVPELIQDQFTGEKVAAALRPLLDDGPARETMVRDLAEVRDRLAPPLGRDPIRGVCDTVESLMSEHRCP
jgi:lipid-A-disaccharide synthase